MEKSSFEIDDRFIALLRYSDLLNIRYVRYQYEFCIFAVGNFYFFRSSYQNACENMENLSFEIVDGLLSLLCYSDLLDIRYIHDQYEFCIFTAGNFKFFRSSYQNACEIWKIRLLKTSMDWPRYYAILICWT